MSQSSASETAARYAESVRRCEERSAEKRAVISARIDALCDVHGSRRKAAKAIGVDHVYLYRLQKGTKEHPSEHTLRKLGLIP